MAVEYTWDKTLGTWIPLGGGISHEDADTNYVKKAGDAMTGPLVAPDIGANTLSAYVSANVAGPLTVSDEGVLFNATGTASIKVDPNYDPSALQLNPPPGGWISASGAVIGAVHDPVNLGDAVNMGWALENGGTTEVAVQETAPVDEEILLWVDPTSAVGAMSMESMQAQIDDLKTEIARLWQTIGKHDAAD